MCGLIMLLSLLLGKSDGVALEISLVLYGEYMFSLREKRIRTN
jgi:hypothetical protein